MWRPKWWHGACLRAILAPLEEVPVSPGDSPCDALAAPAVALLEAARAARIRFADELAHQGLVKGSRYAIHKGKRRRAEELAAAASSARLSSAKAAPAAKAEARALSWSERLDALPRALTDDMRADRSRGAARSAVPIGWALRMKPVAAAVRDALRESSDAAGATSNDAAPAATAATMLTHVAEYFTATLFKVAVAVPERACAARVWTKPLLSAAHAAGGAALVAQMLRCAAHFLANCKHGTTPARYRMALAAMLGNAVALWGPPGGSGRARDGPLWSECGVLLGAAAAMPTTALVIHFAAALFRSLASEHSVRDAMLLKLSPASLRRIRWAVERERWSAASAAAVPPRGTASHSGSSLSAPAASGVSASGDVDKGEFKLFMYRYISYVSFSQIDSLPRNIFGFPRTRRTRTKCATASALRFGAKTATRGIPSKSFYSGSWSSKWMRSAARSSWGFFASWPSRNMFQRRTARRARAARSHASSCAASARARP